MHMELVDVRIVEYVVQLAEEILMETKDLCDVSLDG